MTFRVLSARFCDITRASQAEFLNPERGKSEKNCENGILGPSWPETRSLVGGMSDHEVSISEEEFAEQLRHLAEEAENQTHQTEERTIRKAEAEQQTEERTIRKAFPSLIKALRPLVLGIEALSRATEENTNVLCKLQKASAAQAGLPDLMVNVQEKMDDRRAINQQLFDALHSELKDYKDGFLLEALQKPIIRDLIELHDDLSEIHRQLSEHVESAKEAEGETESVQKLSTIRINFQHTQEGLVEILERMEVVKLDPSAGKLDKHTQRAVSLSPAENSCEDLEIVASLKPGFQWKNRLFRPEEVAIKKWKEGYLTVMPPDAPPAVEAVPESAASPSPDTEPEVQDSVETPQAPVTETQPVLTQKS